MFSAMSILTSIASRQRLIFCLAGCAGMLSLPVAQAQQEVSGPVAVDARVSEIFQTLHGDSRVSSGLRLLQENEPETLAEQVRLNPECSFLGTGNESGTISIHVYSSGGISCTPYTLSYGDS